MQIWTIGHSTRTIADFISALEINRIKSVADVRLLPGSRRYPQFNQDSLQNSLGNAGIRYEHFSELGGRRKPRPDSDNAGWRNAAFRGYADYMETRPFQAGVERLLQFAQETGSTAIMCAEAVWWRCHRGLISDFLKVRGIEVIHIVDEKHNQSHPFTSAARVVEGRLTYQAGEAQLF